MTPRWCVFHAGTRTVAAVVGVVVMTAAYVEAQEYCVGCTGPNVLYRCVIDGARAGLSSSLHAQCITALTKHGNHASCGLRRDLGVIDCNGPIKHIALPAQPNGEATVVPTKKIPDAPKNDGPPKTVEEMLRRATGANQSLGLKKPTRPCKTEGGGVGGFLKNSWTCVASLFSRCSNP